MNIQEFQDVVWEYYRVHGRTHLPWRQDPSPYHVLVSELMLQQTQVERVIPKFNEFLKTFPTIESLAQAPLADVLIAWQGLGYNRRAKFLHEAAKGIVRHGSFPDTKEELIQLPGVGPNTAAAILTYAFNHVCIFVETNIRTVYFHHFFSDQTDVADRQLLALVEQTVDKHNPREWFAALMDYGTYLKQQGKGHISTSRHYVKQSTFQGSARQLRGLIVRELAKGTQTIEFLAKRTHDPRFEAIVDALVQEKLVVKTDDTLRLAD